MGRGRCGFPLSEAERAEVVERPKAGEVVWRSLLGGVFAAEGVQGVG